VISGESIFLVFEGIVAVLVYGILFYPFFACLTTEYKLVGSLLGFVYGALRHVWVIGLYRILLVLVIIVVFARLNITPSQPFLLFFLVNPCV